MTSNGAQEQEGFVRGFHGIPDPHKLSAMSFAELASLLSLCEKDTPKFLVVERELRKHIAKDQAAINLKNVIIGAFVAGIFSLCGVVLGFYLGKQQSNPHPAQQTEERAPPENKLSVSPVEIPPKNSNTEAQLKSDTKQTKP